MSLLITLGLIGAVYLWITKKQKVNKLNADTFQNGIYPITRSLFVIVKQNGQIDQQAGEKYADLILTEQGQDLISKAGFVRIK